MSRLPLCAPSSLRDLLPKLLNQGACLILPGPKMPVPIPLNECVVLNQNRLLWATCHTLYGTARPCVGQLEFAGWLPNDAPAHGCTLHDADGELLASLVPNSQLALADGRATRLRAEQARHQRRAATDPAYAHRWAQRFREASQHPPAKA